MLSLCCVCEQIIRQLAALCIQAQQHSTVRVQTVVATMLGMWLTRAISANITTPASSLAANVQQQLEGSRLLQHVPALLTNAADGLTAIAAALFGESTSTTSSSGSDGGGGSSSSSSSSSSSTVSRDAARECKAAFTLADKLVSVYCNACIVTCGRASSLNINAALPAAPAAARLTLTAFQTYTRLQQVASREDAPAAVLLLFGDATFQLDAAITLGILHREMRTIIGAAKVAVAIAGADRLAAAVPCQWCKGAAALS